MSEVKGDQQILNHYTKLLILTLKVCIPLEYYWHHYGAKDNVPDNVIYQLNYCGGAFLLHPCLLYHFRCTWEAFTKTVWGCVVMKLLTRPACRVWPYQGLWSDTGGNYTDCNRNIRCPTKVGNHPPTALKYFLSEPAHVERYHFCWSSRRNLQMFRKFKKRKVIIDLRMEILQITKANHLMSL